MLAVVRQSERFLRRKSYLYDKARNELLAKHEEIRADIEAKAVMIGL
jgi:hypothetical protein